MTITSDEQVFNAAAAEGDWQTAGFDPPKNNPPGNINVNIYREGGSAQEWVMKENQTLQHTYTNSIGGTKDITGRVVVFWWFTTADSDYDRLTAHFLQLSSDTTFTGNMARWTAQDQVNDVDRYGWTPVLVYPTNPDGTAGTIVYTSIDSIGWVATTGGTGTKLTGFDQCHSISALIGHSQTFTLADLKTHADTNDLGIAQSFGDFYKFNVNVEIGGGTTVNASLTIENETLFFDNVEPEHNLGFVVTDNSTGTNTLIINASGFTWNQQDGTTPEIFSNAADLDIFRVSAASFARGGAITLRSWVSDANTYFRTTTITDCQQIDANTMIFEDNTINAPDVTADEGAMLISNEFTTARQTGNVFTRGTLGHALELDSNVASAITLSGYKYNGYNATTGSNLVANSGPADASIFNDSGKEVTVTISGGGDVPSVRNGAGATTIVVAATSVTLTGLKDNTEVRVLDNVTGEFLDGIENATAGSPDDRSFTFSLAAALTVDIAVFNIAFILPPNNRIENFVIPSTDTSIPLAQVPDRNYKNPV